MHVKRAAEPRRLRDWRWGILPVLHLALLSGVIRMIERKTAKNGSIFHRDPRELDYLIFAKA
jgi:hypothetical protein